MAYLYDPNNVGGTVNGGAQAMWDLKALLVSAGWTVLGSGGGTGSGLYSAVGDILTTATLMNVSRAWFRITDPAGVREFCIQRGSGGNTAWWIRYSALDKFTGGAPDEDDMPTATDVQNVWGTTNAGTALFNTAGYYKYHAAADNAAPYTFYLVTCSNGTGAPYSCFVFDAMVAGSYPSQDADPRIVHCHAGGTPLDLSRLTSAASAPFGWYAMNLGGETWVRFTGHYLFSSGYGQLYPNGMGPNPYTDEDMDFPIAWGRGGSAATQFGWKGFGAMMRWTGSDHSNMQPLSNGRVVFDDISLPWPVGVAPVR